jgi:hypothetical protein
MERTSMAWKRKILRKICGPPSGKGLLDYESKSKNL